MSFGKETDFEPWEPAGLQSLINPRLSRRQLLAGMAAAPAGLAASKARADELKWHDIRFDLSKDERVLSVVEVEVVETIKPPRNGSGAPGGNDRADPEFTLESRTDLCCWRLPVEAFGGEAWFDIDKPATDVGRAPDQASPRSILIRNVGYGAARPSSGSVFRGPPRGISRTAGTSWSSRTSGRPRRASLRPPQATRARRFSSF